MSATRRQFLEEVAALGVSAYVASVLGACRQRTTAAPATTGKSDAGTTTKPVALAVGLTSAELVTVAAVCERLFPRDEDPGAIDLGVPAYIERAIALPALAAAREVIVRLLPALDRQSRKRFAGRAFAEASPDEQDLLLTAWQRGAGGERRFFETMLALTLEGALGDPKHGGNHEGRGFALVGFQPGPPMPKTHHAPEH